MIQRLMSSARTGLCALVFVSLAAPATSIATAASVDPPAEIDRPGLDALRAARAARSPAEQRLHAALAQAERAARSGMDVREAARGLPARLIDGGRILVEIRHEVRGRADGALPGLRELGAEIRRPGHRGLTEAWVPMLELGRLAALPGVQQVSPARRVRTLAGTVTSAGVAAGNLGPWHLSGLDGSGITVAVIDSFDDGADQVVALQASGDWPAPAQISLVPLASATFGDGGNAHGNALLEVVFDVAPGAGYIAYDVATVGDWRDAIDLAVAAGADVIVSALAAPLDGIGDGSALPGSVAERVVAAAAADVLYINAAGNARLRHWGGDYVPAVLPDFHAWNLSTDTVNAVVDGSGTPACIADGETLGGELFWDDWTAVESDYELILLEQVQDGLNLVWSVRADSSNVQDGTPGQTPQEQIEFVALSNDAVVCGAGSGRYGWAIARTNAPTPRNLQFFASHDVQHRVAARSLVFPADSPAAVAVVAIDPGTSLPATDSSEGPILAAGGGLPGGAETPKPDLASFAPADSVSLGVAGLGGTSAAAAHAAGMAAVLKQRHPGFDREALVDRLRAIAGTGSNDLGEPGHDFRFGAGRLRFQAEAGLAVTGSPGTAETGTLLDPVTVELRDDEGDTVLSGPATEVSVAIGNDPSGGAALLSGTATVPLQDGVAAFDDLSIDEPGFAYTLAFAVDSDAAGAESDPFNVVLGGPGVPSQLVFVQGPLDAEAGQPLLPTVSVEVQDSEGVRVVTDNSTAIELVLIDDPGGSGLIGNGPITVSNGVAEFPTLSIDRAGSGYRLRAQTDSFGLVGGESASFDVVAGAPARLTLLNAPANGEIGVPLAPLSVAVTDNLGNPRTDDHSTQITVARVAGPGTLSGTLSRTVSAGVAVFDDLELDAFGSDYRLSFRADIGAIEERLDIADFSLAASESVAFAVDAGLANGALVRGLRFTGTVAGIGGNSSYASDLRMDVSGPSGSTFAVGGFNDLAPASWDFQGSVSSPDGTYLSSHEAIFSSVLGGFTEDAGSWQFGFRNDWANATATMHWSAVSIDLIKDDAYLVSAPFAVGGTEVAISLGDLAQTYDGTPRVVSVSTDPPGVSVAVSYDGDPQPPVLPGEYAVLADVDEEGFFGSASAVLVVAPIEVDITLDDLVQTFTGDPLAVTVMTDPPGVALLVTYDGSPDLPVDVGFYAVEATVTQEGHVGAAAAQFEIRAPGEAAISFDGLAQIYDGTPRTVGVTTDPPGLAVEVDYDGESAAPTDAGSYTVSATVVEPGWSGSDSAELVVAPAATLLLLVSDANPAPIGTSVGFTAEVTGVDPGGSVSFLDDGVVMDGCADVALVGVGATVSAQCSALLPGGERPISAIYAGDANHQGSEDALVQTVLPYATTLELDALVTQSDRGEAASFSATLGVPDGAVFDPTGILAFTATQGAVSESCQVVVSAPGSLGCAITFGAPAAGIFTVTADFTPGDGSFEAASTAVGAEHSVFRVADLALAKRAQPALVEPGEVVDFVIELDNLGPDEAVAAALLDAMPVELLNPVWVCEGSMGALCPNADGVGDIDESVDLPAAGRLVYTVSGTLDVEAALPVSNQAVVAASGADFTRDPQPDNNIAEALVQGERVFGDGFESEAPPEPETD